MKKFERVIATACALTIGMSIVPAGSVSAAETEKELIISSSDDTELKPGPQVSIEAEEEVTESATEDTTVAEDALSGSCGESAAFEIVDGVLTISGTGAISENAFEYRTDFTSVVIEEGITEIGAYAFYYCESITSVTLPESLTVIGSRAFYKCYYLAEITIPAGVTEIGDKAFYYCSKLARITFSGTECTIYDSSDTISSGAVIAGYAGSTAEEYALTYGRRFLNLETGEESLRGYCGDDAIYTLDNEVLTVSGTGAISDYAFTDKTNFTSVVIEEGITSIGSYAFSDCDSMTSIILPESLTAIGARAFYDSDYITEITIPTGVSEIGERAFYSCARLVSVTINSTQCVINDSSETFDSIAVIAGYAGSTVEEYVLAYGKKFLNLETGEESVRGYCGENAMYTYEDGVITVSGTGEMTSFYLNSSCTLESAVIGEGITSMGDNVFSNHWTLASVTIPESVTSIGNRAFYNTAITEISLPSGVTSIGEEAFSGCKSLSSVTIPESVTSIGEETFGNCTGLTAITLPETLTSIGIGAFSGSGLTEITIPESVTEIGSTAFYDCESLLIAYIMNPECVIADSSYNFPTDTVIAGYAGSTAQAFAVNYGFAFMDIETGETTITGSCGDDATYEIVDGVLYISGTGAISSYAFSENDKFTSVVINEGITSVGYGAFRDCLNLTSVTFPETLTTIEENAFLNTGLTEVVIPESVTTIEGYSFTGCEQLSMVTVLNPECDIYTDGWIIRIPTILAGYSGSTAQTYAESRGIAFMNLDTGEITQKGICGETASYEIVEGVLIISGTGEIDDSAFDCDTHFNAVVIEEGITSIGERAFYECTAIESVTLPSSLVSIGSSAFCDCTALKTVSFSEGLETIGGSAFRYTGLTEVTVPASVTSIGNFAFDCSSLTSATILNPECTLGTDAIYSGAEIIGYADSTAEAYAVSGGLRFTDIETGESSFRGSCGDTCEYFLDEGVLTIEGTGAISENAFKYRTDFTSVIIGEGITSIGADAFYDCEYLTSVALPESLTEIGSEAFCYSGITEITIPAGVVSVGHNAFSSCYSLEKITFLGSDCEIYDYYSTIYSGAVIAGYPGSGAETYARDYNRIFMNLETGETATVGNCGETATYTLSAGVLTISGTGAVSDYAFSGEWFSDYDTIEKVIIEEGITAIGINSFDYCYNISSISIPSTVTSIPASAISGTNISEFTLSPENTSYVYEDGILYNTDKTVLCAYILNDVTSCTIPENVTKIESHAFAGRDNLTEVVIPETVAEIGENAFISCYSLNNVTVLNPNCVIADSELTFAGMASTILTGYADSTLHAYALSCNAKFRDIETGGITGKCGEDAYFTFEGGIIEITGTGAIDDYAFYNDSSVVSVIIGEGITSIGEYSFGNCENLKQITLPESLTAIGLYSFTEAALSEVVLSENVSEIGSGAFGGCVKLETLTIMNPACVIYDSSYTIYSNTVIAGYADSTADAYALSYGRAFMDLETGKIVTKGVCGETATYTLSEGVLTISGTGAIDGDNFNYNDDIISVIIEEGITTVGSQTFYSLENLNSVSFPSTVTAISADAFYDCDALRKIEISEENSVYCYEDGYLFNPEKTVIYAYMLNDEATLVVPSTVTEISANAFNGKYNLEKIEITENVAVIGEKAFYGCYNLSDIIIDNPACEIYDSRYTLGYNSSVVITGYADSTAHAYALNYNLKFADMETGMISGKCGDNAYFTLTDGELVITGTGEINKNAFDNDNSITSVIISEGIESVGSEAFYSCDYLEKVTLPESLALISNYAFSYTGITEMTIPAGAAEIDYNAFNGCYNLEKLTIMNPACVIYDSSSTIYSGAVIAGYADSTADVYAASYGRKFMDIETGEIVIKGSCGESADYIISGNVLTISGTGVIDASAFEYNYNFTEVVIEEGITAVSEKAFRDCQIEKISVPSTVGYIAPDAFEGVNTITEFTISEDNEFYTYAEGCLLSADKSVLVRCISFDSMQTVLETVSVIGEKAFNGCDAITSIVIPANVTAIKAYAFGNCSNLERITIMNPECEINDAKATICNSYYEDYQWIYDDETGEEVKQYYCYGETYSGMICGYSESTAYEYAFNYGRIFMDIETGEITQKGKCGDNLVYEIKNGILNITGTGTMYDMPDFSGNTKITDAVIAEGAVSLGAEAFEDCSSLRAVSLPSTLTTIGDNAFDSCYNLDSIIIPENVTSIGDYAFYDCYSLGTVIIPSKVEYIGSCAFYDCSLREIILPESVKTVGSDAFYYSTLNTITILNPECDIAMSSSTLPRYTIIYGYADSTAKAYAFEYGRKFVDIETGVMTQTGQCGANLFFSIENGILTITGTGDMYDSPVFNDSYAIYDVVIGEGVTSLGDNAFYGCYNISTITLPAGINDIGVTPFKDCTGLEEIIVAEDNQFYSSIDGVLFNKAQDTLIYYPYGLSDDNYEVPASVAKIESGAFTSSYADMVTITNKDCVIESGAFNKYIVICGYDGSTAEQYAYDNNRYFCDIETGKTTLRGRCGASLVYEMTMSGVLTISGTGDMYSSAFSGNDDIVKVIIEPGAESIGYDAFYNCDSLESIEIPDTVTLIDSWAFEYSELESVTIPSSVKKIGSGAFYNCYALESVTLSEGLESIGSSAFDSCDIAEITIPASVKEIGGYAFDDCYYLTDINAAEGNEYFTSADGVLYDKAVTKIIAYPYGRKDTEYTVPETVTHLENEQLDNYSLEKVVILNPDCEIEDDVHGDYSNYYTIRDNIVVYGYENSTAQAYTYKFGKKFCIIGTEKIIQQGKCGDGLTYDITEGVLTISGTGAMYDEPLFMSNDEITSVVIEEGVTSIGRDTFYHCDNITEVSIASTVSSVGDEAFSYCTGLTSITIPETVKTLGDRVFVESSSLEEIIVDANNPSYASADGVLFDKAMQQLIYYPGAKKAEEYEIPGTVTSINDYAFSNCRNITSVVVPEGVTYFGFYSFYNCEYLETINFPSTLETIGNSAFYGCSSLACDIIIPEGMKSVGDSAFAECSSITRVVLPESVSLIDYHAFYGCYDLESITISNKKCKIYEESETISRNAVICGYAGSTAYDYAFENGREFMDIETEEVTLKGQCGPNLVYEIKDNVITITGTGEMYDNPQFKGNDEITAAVIGEGATTIGEGAFSDCDSLASVSLPETLVAISADAFAYCYDLTEINIPDSVMRIGDQAFYDCSSLASVTLPSKLREISQELFADCSSLEEIVIPEGIRSIKSGAFRNCYNLTTATLPESLTKIESSAFYSCSALEAVTIPEAVTSIGNNAFGYCEALTAIIIPAAVEEIASGAFSGCSSLTAFEVDAANESYISSEGVLYDYAMTTLVAYPSGKTDTEYTVPAGVEKISSYAFYGNSSITEITFGEDVKNITHAAVTNCENLVNVTIKNPDCVIGDQTNDDYYYSSPIYAEMITGYAGSTAEEYAFEEEIFFRNIETDEVILRGSCGENAEYTIKDGVLTITGTGSVTKRFYNTDVTSVVIGKEITSVERRVLDGLENLESITVEEGNENLIIEEDVLYNTDKTILVFYPSYKTDKEFVIPDSVKTVNGIYSESIEKVTIGENTDFRYYYGDGEEDYYYNCYISGSNFKEFAVSESNSDYSAADGILYDKEQTEIVAVPDDLTGAAEIPDTVTHIDEYAFSGRENLTSVKLPSEITEINYSLFSGCTKLETVEIPETVTHIYSWAFEASGVKEIVIPGDVQYIGSSAFSNCQSLRKIVFTNPETAIEGFEVESEYYEDNSFSVINNFCQFGTYDEETGEFIENIQYRYDGVICGPENSSAQRYAEKWGYTFLVYNGEDGVLNVDKTAINLSLGEQTIIIANKSDVTFTSADDSLVAVDENGEVTATGYGSAVITVSDGAGNIVEVTVKVSKEGEITPPPVIGDDVNLGDVDSDGSVNAVDASMVLKEYALLATGGDGELSDAQRKAGDVNKDGAVDATDASSILAYYAYKATGGEDSFEVYLEKK